MLNIKNRNVINKIYFLLYNMGIDNKKMGNKYNNKKFNVLNYS